MTELFQSPSRIAIIIWKVMLSGILLDLLLIALATMSVDSPLNMPEGPGYVTKATVPLLVYGFVFLRVTAIRVLHSRTALRLGTTIGIVCGLLQVTHMALENFGNRIGENSIVTLAFMVGGFLVWGFAGYCAARETKQLKDGIVAGCWSAMISVLMAVTFGLVLMTANIPSPAYVATWREFKQSGWTNAHAFAIANSLDAVLSHLIIGPVVGVIFGFFGGGIAKLAFRRSAAAPGC